MKDNKKALIIVDYQNDFVDPTTGSLYVKGAEKILDKLLLKIKEFKKNNDLVIASKDYHPLNHSSFKIWPPHCLQNNEGSKLYRIDETLIDKIILKGQDKNKESYSVFFDEEHKSNGLDEYLKKYGVKEIVIVGVALDVCVSATLKDAIKLNYNGYLDIDLTANLKNQITF